MLAETVTPTPVSQPGLTAFEESANATKVSDAHDTSIERFIANPFPVDQPLELLQRTYQIANITWTPVYTGSTYYFPGAFFSNVTLNQVLSRFAWFRANVHIEIKMQSTPFHQGSLVVGWLPCPGTATFNTLQQISGYDCTVLSASVQDTCSYDIPYLNPIDWIPGTIGSPLDASIAGIFIKQLNPLTATSANVPLSVPVMIFASFKDIQVTGYRSQMKTGSPFKKNNEAHAKQQQGLDAKTIVSAGSQLLRQVPVLGQIYSPIADAINNFAGDLAKPVSTEANCNMLTPYYNDVNQAAGLTNATTLSLYPNPVLKQAPNMFGMETSHISVSGLAQRPLLYDTAIFNGTDVVWEAAVQPDTLGGTVTGRDYLASMAAIHRYWRGSVKYLVHFCMPAFYSCRVRFSIDYMGGGAPQDYGDLMTRLVDVKGDTWEEITVPYLQRTTWSDRTMNAFPPFLKIFQFTPIVGSSDPTTPIMYVNIWRAGGEDIQFSGLLDTDTITPYAAPSARTKSGVPTSQMHVGSRFKKAFPGINKGETLSVEKSLTMSEVTGTVADVLKRHQLVPSNAGTLPHNMTPVTSPFAYLTRFFMFWRGGRIQRRIHYDANAVAATGAFLGIGSVNKICNGWAPVYANAAGVFQPEAFHVPYYHSTPYYPVLGAAALQVSADAYFSEPVDINTVVTTTNSATTLAAADDFVLLHIVPWGNLTTITPPPMVRQVHTPSSLKKT